MSTKVNLQRFFSRFPVIDLGNIRLRDLMLSDKEKYFEMMSDSEVVKFQSDEDIPTTIVDTESEIKFWGGLFYRKQSVFWAIADSETDKFIGTIGYNNWNFTNRRGEISYDLMSEYWRKGIMTKALTNGLSFGFKEMDLYRIEARTMTDNIPSRKILEKVGFKLEGIQRGYRIIRNVPVDIALYSIIRPDFSIIS
jgi:[ribosomal protein S5]-alanine N-acetyltransferase